MLHLYEQKSESRGALVRQARRAMLELVQAMRDGLCDHPEAEQLMQELAAGLGTVKGKKTYGYLSERLKGLVDQIVGPGRWSGSLWCANATTSGSCSGKGGQLLPRHAREQPATALPREGVPADQKCRIREGGTAAVGSNHLRGPGHGPAGRARAIPKCALCVPDAAGGHPK